MRTIVHLSDMHFGRIDPDIPPALLLAVKGAMPDLIVVSGDLTQRARVQEFKDARRFLTSLPGPLLVVPGNHDVPLYDVLRRWIAPLGRYRRYITDDLAPFYADEEIAVLGVNTARALTFKNGRINRDQLAAVTERLAACGPGVTKMIVTHHPFDGPEPRSPGPDSMHGIVGRAEMAMAEFLQARVDIILSGHTHVSHIMQTAQRYRLPGRSALLIQAGTATSTRKRGQLNGFNVMRIAGPEVTVDSMVWNPTRVAFDAGGIERFRATDAGWSRVEPRIGPYAAR